jgi:hypothetical protein
MFLELRILKELWARLAELRILKDLAESRRAERIGVLTGYGQGRDLPDKIGTGRSGQTG